MAKSNSNPVFSAVTGFLTNVIPFTGYLFNAGVTRDFSNNDLSTYATAGHISSGISALVTGFSTVASLASFNMPGAIGYGILTYGEYKNYSSINQVLDSHSYIGNIGIVEYNDHYDIYL